VFGVHGDVGLELALPPALFMLQAEQVSGGAVARRAGERVGRRRARLHHCLAVTNSAMAANSARTSSGSSASSRLPSADDSALSASASTHFLPPAAATRSAARRSSASSSGSGAARSTASSRPASLSLARAATTGSDFFLDRRSDLTGLPVTSGAPQIPSRSSVSWKASPMYAPKAVSDMAVLAGAPT